MAQNDDDVWRAIIDNYGDRADLEDQAGSATDAAAQSTEPTPEDLPGTGQPPAEQPAWADAFPDSGWEEDRFVPPPPPPLPTTTTDRMVAWVGIFGSPAVLLLSLILDFRLPELINYVLVLGFVGGFLYLVIKMNREPRDPNDNGAVL